MRASLAVIIALPVAAGCGPATIEAEEESSAVCGTGGPGQTSREAFAQAMGEMSGEFGTDGDTAVPEECLGKADWLSVPDPCELLAPLIPFGDDVLRPGLVAGVEGQGVLGTPFARTTMSSPTPTC